MSRCTWSCIACYVSVVVCLVVVRVMRSSAFVTFVWWLPLCIYVFIACNHWWCVPSLASCLGSCALVCLFGYSASSRYRHSLWGNVQYVYKAVIVPVIAFVRSSYLLYGHVNRMEFLSHHSGALVVFVCNLFVQVFALFVRSS